jgi:DNA sulfur modification protein DndB
MGLSHTVKGKFIMSFQSFADAPRIGQSTPSFQIPAIAYRSGGRIWYAATLTMEAVGNFVSTSSIKKQNQEIIKTEIKNRFLDREHKEEIKNYLKEEPEFIIPPITLVSPEPLIFVRTRFENELEQDRVLSDKEFIEKYGSATGFLVVNVRYKFECLDGNHRSVAIRELAEEAADYIKDSHLLLNIVVEDRVRKIRQDFVDVNKNAKSTTPSINTLFNTRDPLSNLVADTLEKFKWLTDTTELLSTSVSKNAKEIYTLNNLKNAVVEIAGYHSFSGVSKKLYEDLANPSFKAKLIFRVDTFFNLLSKNPTIRTMVIDRDQAPALRTESLIPSGTGIIICAKLFNFAFEKFNEEEALQTRLKNIIDYDWSRTNSLFQGTVIVDEKIQNSRKAILTATEFLAEDILGITESVNA